MTEMDDRLDVGYRAKNGRRHDASGLNSHTRTILIIKLPDSRSLRVLSRSLFLAMLLLALPWLLSLMRDSSDALVYDTNADLGINTDGFKVLLRDLLDQGLIKKGHKGFLLGAPAIQDDVEFLRRDAAGLGIDFLAGAAPSTKQKNQVFDYVYAPSFHDISLIDDGILKDGGLVILPLGLIDPSDELRLLRNFKIVYLRRFENTVVAMRKAAPNGGADLAAKQAFCHGITPEKKKATFKGLEDVYLEPPRRRRAALVQKSSFTVTSRRIKFLPDLLKDPLYEYPRRLFISDDSNALDWFYNNYPMRDQEFEVYNMEVVRDENDGWSDWIRKIDVRPEDYVVVKAEGRAVEQMMRDRTLCLVDELFLECKNEWEQENASKRPYWQCLALYGEVRDEGIAVHQWWY